MIKIPKPKAILLELTGSLATREFMTYSKSHQDFVRMHIHEYFDACYPKQKDLRLDVNFFKNQEQLERKNRNFNSECPSVIDESRRLPLPSVVIGHILFRIDHQDYVPPLTLFMLHFNEWAYKKGIYSTPVYKEVRCQLELWKREKIAVYVDAASETFVQMVLSNTTQGNLWSLITRNISLMQFRGANSFRDFTRLPTLLNCSRNEIVVITRFAQDAKQASQNGFETLLLLRDDFEPNWRQKEKKAFPPKRAKQKSKSIKKETKLSTLTGPLESRSKIMEKGQSMSKLPALNQLISKDSGSKISRESSSQMKSVTSKLIPDTNDDDDNDSDDVIGGVSAGASGLMGSKKMQKSSSISISSPSNVSKLETAFNGIDLGIELPDQSQLDKKSSAICNLPKETATKILSMAESIESFHSGSSLNLNATTAPASTTGSVINYKDLRQVRYINSLDQITFV